jgi:transposase
LRSWLRELPCSEGDFAVEATTGWRFIVEELERAGFIAHLAEPADTSAARGRKRRAKTDRADARLLRELLQQGRLPESWIGPSHILDLRETTRLRHTLAAQRTQWHQRIHADLYHLGVAKPQGGLATVTSRAWVETIDVPPAVRHAIRMGLAEIDHLNTIIHPIDRWLKAYSRLQPGCRALCENHYGVGAVTAATILGEVGDVRRFHNGDAIVRYTGLDITVHSSDGKTRPGRLARQGPPALRWALYEAAICAARTSSPDHTYYQQVKARKGGKRPALSVARKLIRRIRHTLIELDDEALTPVDSSRLPDLEETMLTAA